MALRQRPGLGGPPRSITPDKELWRIYGPVRADLERMERVLSSMARRSGHLVRPMACHLIRKRGKRIRPALVLLSALSGRTRGPYLPELAAAIEMLHMASLVHDDIIDGASRRRNQVSLHKMWGTHLSVLMGDFLFAKVSWVVSTMFSTEVMKILMRASQQLCDGAIEETAMAFHNEITEKRYLEIIDKKTASLMSAACECGAAAACAPPRVVRAMGDYGRAFGMAFQLMDDALDFSGDEEKLGKPVGSDIMEGKFTMPVLFLRSHLKEGGWDRIARLLTPESLSNGGARKVIALVKGNGGIERTLERANMYLEDARNSLARVPERTRVPLIALAEYASRRTR